MYILAPQTIGPFKHSFTEFLAKGLLNKTRLIHVRDQLSKQFVNKITGNREIVETTDVAFKLDYENNSIDKKESGLKIGINISGLLFYNSGDTDKRFNLKLDYKSFIYELIKELSSNESYKIHLIPHVICKENNSRDDFSAICELKEAFTDLIVPKPFGSPVEAKSYIANMDFFIGSRMHSTIAAISSGVPIVPVSYSRKFEGVFSGLEYEYGINGKEMDNQSAISYILKCLNSIESIKNSVEISRNIAIEKLSIYETSLKNIFKEILNAKSLENSFSA